MSSYTVSSLNGCKLVKGEVPVLEFVALLNVWGDKWVIDGELADALGVNLVIGPPDHVSAWREQLEIDKGDA